MISNKLLILLTVLILLTTSIILIRRQVKNVDKSDLIEKTINKDMYKYSIESLLDTKVKKGEVKIKNVLEEKDVFTSYLFEFSFNPNLDEKTTKKISGMLNLPKKDGKFPIVVMIRGYVDPKNYKTGMGSKNLSYFLAEKGFITISPDFLGYSESDREAENIFESRFQTYTTVISLIESLEDIKEWDGKNIFIWGHSNGGQIALYILEATKKDIPTVLWAPVSAPFPYSILYYTIESDDKGKFIRKELAKFEENYDVEKFSITNYLENINTKIEIHQGGEDSAVPFKWSENLYKRLLTLKKDVNYHFYQNADHNLRPNWHEASYKTLEFYKNLTK